jgi:hypothetical protein
MNKTKNVFFTICAIAGLFDCKNLKAQDWKTITACPDDSIQTWLTRYHVPVVAIGIILRITKSNPSIIMGKRGQVFRHLQTRSIMLLP